jgi:hypothetical protein
MVKTKKIFFLFLFLFFGGYFCRAQTPDNGDENRVEVVKMAYLTRELNLTPQEAQNFWPVYNNYVNEIKQARDQYPNDEVAFEKKVVEIKEHYQGNFKKVLGNSDERVNKVYTTDKKFNNTLRNELNRRQNFQQAVPENNGMRGNGTKRQRHPI